MNKEKRQQWIALLDNEEVVAILDGLDAATAALDERRSRGAWDDESSAQFDYVNELRNDIKDARLAAMGWRGARG